MSLLKSLFLLPLSQLNIPAIKGACLYGCSYRTYVRKLYTMLFDFVYTKHAHQINSKI